MLLFLFTSVNYQNLKLLIEQFSTLSISTFYTNMDEETEEYHMEDIKDLFILNIRTITNTNKREMLVHKNLDFALNCVKNILHQINTSIDDFQNKSKDDILEGLRVNLHKCVCLLDSLISLFNHLTTLDPIKLSYYENLPLNVIQILFSFFSHCKNREKMYSENFQEITPIITDIFKKCLELKVLYFSVLVDYIIIELDSDEELSILFSVIRVIADINEIVINLDIKTMAEGWKGYIKISEKYACYIKNEMIHFKATSVLCETIKKNLLYLLTDNVSKIKQNRYLKMSDFGLKILIKLTDVYSGYLSENLDHIIAFLVVVYNNSPSHLQYINLKPNLIEEIRTNITIGTELLLVNLLKDKYFKMSYFDQIQLLVSDESLRFGCFFLTLSIVKLLADQNDNVKFEWTNENENIICLLFDIIRICEMELLKNIKFENSFAANLSIYDFTLMCTTGLLVSCKKIAIIEHKMIQCLVKPHLLTAMFACDLWMTISCFSSLEYYAQKLEYLIEVYNALTCLSSFENSPQKIYIGHIIYSLFEKSTTSTKEKLFIKYPIVTYWMLWNEIGVCNFPEKSIVNKSLNIVELSSNTFKSLLKLDNNLENHFLTMVKNLKLLTTVPFLEYRSLLNIREISHLIINIWNYSISFKDIEISSQNSSTPNAHWYCKFILLLLDATFNIGFELNQEDWIHILNLLFSQIEKLPSLIKLGVLQTLEVFIDYEISENEDGQKLVMLIINLFQKIYDDVNPIIHLTALETIVYFSLTLKNSEKNLIIMNKLKLSLSTFFTKKSDDFLEISYLQSLHDEFEHKCKVSEINLFSKNYLNSRDHFTNNKVSSCLETIKSNINMLNSEHLSAEQISNLKTIRETIDNLIFDNSL